MGKKVMKFLKDRGDLLLFNGLIASVISLSFNYFLDEGLNVYMIAFALIPFVVGNILYAMITRSDKIK